METVLMTVLQALRQNGSPRTTSESVLYREKTLKTNFSEKTLTTNFSEKTLTTDFSEKTLTLITGLKKGENSNKHPRTGVSTKLVRKLQ